jgi:hypothetical protein
MMKYLGGNIFANVYLNAVGEIMGKLLTGPILACFGLKRLFLIALSLAIISSVLLIYFDPVD